MDDIASPHPTSLILVLLMSLLLSGGCFTGRLYLIEAEPEAPRLQNLGLRARLEPLPRMQSNKYQDAFEDRFEQNLVASHLFESVTRDAAESVDVVLRIAPSMVAFNRRVNLAYFPLALATLTLYIWVGGPIATDFEFYDLGVRAETPDGQHLFDARTHERKKHWIGFYSREYWNGNGRCYGPHANDVIGELIEDIGAGLRRLEASEAAAR